jgi:hypothetical protein
MSAIEALIKQHEDIAVKFRYKSDGYARASVRAYYLQQALVHEAYAANLREALRVDLQALDATLLHRLMQL